MFAGLDDIPWGQLKHAYGDAADVPGQIRSLLSSDGDERRDALQMLFSNIWHQGTVYQATSHALPFLVEVLASDRLEETDGVVLLVASIVAGTGYHQVHSTKPMINPFTGQQMTPPPNLEELLAQERRIVDDVQRAGVAALDLLIPHLDHELDDIRATVAKALGRYPSRAASHRPLLEAALRNEKEAWVRVEVERSLRALDGAAEQTIAD